MFACTPACICIVPASAFILFATPHDGINAAVNVDGFIDLKCFLCLHSRHVTGVQKNFAAIFVQIVLSKFLIPHGHPPTFQQLKTSFTRQRGPFSDKKHKKVSQIA
jgi:hypothetical protein